jgi:probable rRNA maturation factor
LVKLRIVGKIGVSKKQLEQLAEKVLKLVGIREAVEVGLFFVSDQKMKALNTRYRNVSSSTDDLSFPLENAKCSLKPKVFCQLPKTLEKPVVLGDIFISTETARRQAKKAGHFYQKEIEFLVMHGLLHLAGLDHEKSVEQERAWDRLIIKFRHSKNL